jgi:DNA polymerase II large subunit
MIEIRNESHCNLMVRIVKVKATGNIFVYIEDVPQNITYKEQQELHDKEGYELIESHWYCPLEKIYEAEC